MPSLSFLKATTRAALLGTTALVATATGAQAFTQTLSVSQNTTFDLNAGDSLIIDSSGEIVDVSPGVTVAGASGSITIESGGDITSVNLGIELQGIASDLAGGIIVESTATVTGVTTGAGILGTGILVHTGAGISGGIDNSGTISGGALGIKIDSIASISGGLTNSGIVFGNDTAVLVDGDSTLGDLTHSAIVNTGTIGITSTATGGGAGFADYGIKVTGTNSDISGVIDNSTGGIIYGDVTAIVVSAGDISGGIDNSGVIGANGTTGTATVTGDYGIYVTSGGNISGGIVNSGTIIADTTAIDVAGGSITGGINNSGKIIGGSSAGDAAISLGSGTLGTTANIGIANQTGGLISGNVAINVSSGAIVHGITNSGTIYGTGAGGAINAEDSFFVANITNNSGGLIGVNVGGTTANNTGIFFDNTDSTGGITNNGVIVGDAKAISITNGSELTGAIANSTTGVIGYYATGTNRATTGIFIDNSTVTGGISNSGKIIGSANSILLDNSSSVGSLTNASGGVIAASAAAILVQGGSQITGVLSNVGTIGNATTGVSTATKGIVVTGSSSDIGGGVNNSGTIKGTIAAIEVAANGEISGGIINSSVLGGSATIDGIHVNGGSVGTSSAAFGISNTATGTIIGTNAGILVDAGGSILADIENAGTIYGADFGISVLTGGDINGITNSGLIGATSGGAYADTAAILVGGATSNISGVITNTGDIRSDLIAISLITGGSITGGIANGIGGLIQGDGGAAINIAVGTIVGSTSGTGISNASGGVIRGTNIAINVLGSVEGGIGNFGTIEATASGDAAIYVSGITASVTGSISNAVGGIIQGTNSADGIQISVSASVTGGISNSGTISGDNANGIALLSGASLTGDITNAVIGADISGGATGILLSNATLTGSIINTGSITGSSGAGIVLTNAAITGTITNNSDADIQGSDYGIVVGNGASIAGGISNTGSIAASNATGTGILIANTASVGTITNSGTIAGGGAGYGIFVSTGATVTSITNSGEIEGGLGSIQLGSGSETLTLQTGSDLIGGADGGLGTDTLVLTGNGDEDEDFTNFENLTVSASASDTWDLQGTSTIAAVTLNSGTLEISGDFTATSASLAGGSLNVSSGGSFAVGTISATSGDLDVAGTLTATGSVAVGGALNVTNSGVLNALSLNVTDDADISGDVNITNGVVVGGALNVASTGTLDADTVSATDVDVEGLITTTSGVTVSGILSGSGTIVGGLVTVNGTLSPGNSPGLITVPSLALGNGSVYLVEHEVGGTPVETDITVATGTATIGSDVDVNVSLGAGTDGFSDVILSAVGGITGTFDEVIGLDDNVVGLVSYDLVAAPETATLVVAKTDALAATIGTVSDAGFVFLDNLQEGARRDGRVWATAYIYSAENEGLGNNGADFDQDAFGFNAGVDVISQPNLKVGLAVGYIDGDIDIDSATSDAENDGIFGAAYLNYMNDNFYLDGAIMIGQQTVDTTRTLTTGIATGSVDATSYGANLEAGFELEALGGRLSPFVKVGIHSASLDSYSESGAAGAMTVGEVETQQMRVGAGFRYAVDFGSADGIQVTPAIKLGMTQEWQNGDSSADIGFVGYTGSTKASLDFEDQTTIDLGISFDVKLSQAVTAFVGWDTALGDETTRNTGTIGLSVNW